jgi:hypothetical protein
MSTLQQKLILCFADAFWDRHPVLHRTALNPVSITDTTDKPVGFKQFKPG